MSPTWWVVDLVGAMLGVWAVRNLSRRRVNTIPLSCKEQAVRDVARNVGRIVAPEQALKRALCVTALTVRGDLESRTRMARENVEPHKVHELASLNSDHSESLNAWLRSQGLWQCLSGRETRLMSAPLASWTQQEITESTHRREASGAIGWAIGLLPSMPAWDTCFDGECLPEALGLARPIAETRQRLWPRPQEDIQQARDTAELWLWRARTRQLMKDNPTCPMPQGMTFEKILLLTAQAAKESGLLQPIDNDFPALGKAYRDLTDPQWSTLHNIAYQRLHALNWLCSYSDDWDNVPCHT